jgi:hypothetical protein
MKGGEIPYQMSDLWLSKDSVPCMELILSTHLIFLKHSLLYGAISDARNYAMFRR